jgi:hypothetical protein
MKAQPRITRPFTVPLQNGNQRRFSIPAKAARQIGIGKSKKKFHLRIWDMSGALVYDNSKSITSGKEITGANMKAHGLGAGERIRVQIRGL